MKPVKPLNTADIEARLAAATPGPWRWYKCGKNWLLWADHGMREVVIDAWRGNFRLRDFAKCLMIPFYPLHPDAELIAAAPCDIRALLDEVRELREALKDAFKEGVKKGRGCAGHHWSSLYIASAARARLEGRMPADDAGTDDAPTTDEAPRAQP